MTGQEVLDAVCVLLDRETSKARENNDLATADLIDTLRAKVKVHCTTLFAGSPSAKHQPADQ